ncbi:FtsW/RodA/SpoVE family cell cycle protein [Corynebacterium cystitidis]|uniref:Probable peptidoglycan glycosyltransferase FtsW n=1 Tax=Corynebacterium cystitidis DSM 20524 TaxID=1121357 RepID=A0A1H9NPY0_9CORY|nr:Lipid II flippase FtsW [Corynebacterium cystitidis DSM 20524]SER37988.1 cell division protein FtsW [Corynebacterium cystitidis DSM 20524]SNV70625.1 cell division protein FtsW [Corynebacterium cystitidis]
MTTTRPTRPTQPNQRRSKPAQAIDKAAEWMTGQPLLDYQMIRTIVLVLAGLGVVMVTSSSMTWSVIDDQTVWAQPVKQALMVVLGLIAFYLALRISPERIRRWAPWMMLIAVILLIVVLTPLGTGRESVGSQSWIALPGFQLQPSEFAKAAIAIWGASLLANKDPRSPSWNNGFIPFTGVSVLCFVLIAGQGDFGMAISFGIVVGFVLVFAGISWLWVGAVAAFGAVLVFLVLIAGGFRSHRFHVFFDALFGRFEDTQDTAFQSYQGFLSLADGSLFGVGLGQSRAKWFYLPEAKNDFIFAVIGEELGLWGGALVILMFFGLGFFGLRAARRARNQYQSLLAASLTAGVVSQAFINIGYVVGLLPVTGIQLPMISAGGTSAIITLGSMGLLASVARHEPPAVSSMQNHGRPLFDRLFGIPEPTAPGQRKISSHDEPRGERSKYGQPVTARRREAPVRARVTAPERVRRERGETGVDRHRRRDGGADRPRRAPSALDHFSGRGRR